jgi:hypothetical protein
VEKLRRSVKESEFLPTLNNIKAKTEKVRIFRVEFEFKTALFRQNKSFPFAFGLRKQIDRRFHARDIWLLSCKISGEMLICSIIVVLLCEDGKKMVGSSLSL